MYMYNDNNTHMCIYIYICIHIIYIYIHTYICLCMHITRCWIPSAIRIRGRPPLLRAAGRMDPPAS